MSPYLLVALPVGSYLAGHLAVRLSAEAERVVSGWAGDRAGEWARLAVLLGGLALAAGMGVCLTR